MIFNILILLLALLILMHLFYKSRLYFICLLPFTVQYLWIFLSILVIENGIYINEQDRDGTFVYANFYLLCFFITTIISFIFFYQVFNKSFKLNVSRVRLLKFDESQLILIISFFVLSVAYLNLLLSPSTFTDPTVDKFNYWNNAKFTFLKPLLGNTIGFLPFIFGITFKRKKKTTFLLALLYSIYLIGIGQKFTSFLLGSISFATAYYIAQSDTIKTNLFFVKRRYLIAGGILLFGLIWYRYTQNNPFRHLGLQPFESVFYRAFGLQGHLFWGVVERYISGGEPKSWDISQLNYGMHVLMEDFYPEKSLKYLPQVWERGVSWTNAYPAILIKIFPFPIALIVHFFLFSLVPLLYVLLRKSLLSSNFLISVFLFQLILWCVNAYIMAYFFRLNKIILLLIFLFFAKETINALRIRKTIN